MRWTIYRLPGGREVTRYFGSYASAEKFAERVASDERWAGAIMCSSSGDEISIGEGGQGENLNENPFKIKGLVIEYEMR